MGEAREPPLGDRGSSGSVDRDSCNMGSAEAFLEYCVFIKDRCKN